MKNPKKSEKKHRKPWSENQKRKKREKNETRSGEKVAKPREELFGYCIQRTSSSIDLFLTTCLYIYRGELAVLVSDGGQLFERRAGTKTGTVNRSEANSLVSR
jgi:hypothetical protein